MNNKQLKTILKAIEYNGGCNIDLNNNLTSYNNGFMVSIIDVGICDHYNILDIKKLIKLSKKTIKKQGLKNAVIGCWNEKKLIYIDISMNINDKEKAIKEGLKHNQLAVYDIKNNNTIYIKKIKNN